MSELKVMMFGASRSGKTSILASMLEGCKKLYKYDLQLNGVDDTSSFVKAIREMKDLCDSKNPRERMTTLWGTNEIQTYKFNLSYLDAPSAGKSTIVIYDVPGEIFDTMEEHRIIELEQDVQQCQIIIVAFDTPAMLWSEGEGQTYQAIISCTDALQRLLPHLGRAIDENRGPGNKCLKSIIFAPIKCECYLHKDSNKFMHDIEAAIRNIYSEILDRVRDHRYKVSIIPMETIGGVYFTRYSDMNEMKVLFYNPNKEFELDDEGKLYEDRDDRDTTPDGEFIERKITRCEIIDDYNVTLARTGQSYALEEGDYLIPTSQMPKYPYVYDTDKAIPYIWYKPNGRGFKQKDCEKVLYEIIKMTIQQLAADSRQDINTILNSEGNILERFLDGLGISGFFENSKQRRELCKALKKMSQGGVFDDTIVLLNNIDKDYSTGLKIRQQ